MATPLDLGLLHYFSAIFPFLLIFAVVYGALNTVGSFNKNKGLQAMIALCFAFLSLMFPVIRDTIALMAPWVVLVIFFIIFLLILIQLFGVSMKDIAKVLHGDEWGSSIVIWIIAIMLIIFLGSLTSVLSSQGGIGGGNENDYRPTAAINATTGKEVTQEADFWRTIVHPKVLGLALILLIGTFSIQKLTSTG